LPNKAARRIGIDLSVLDRSESGTSVYAESLFQAIRSLELPGYEIIALRAPRPMPRRNILTKLGNFFLEVLWLTLLLPVKVRRLRLDLLHMPANTISPFLRIPQVCSIHDAHFMTNPKGRDPLWMIYARLTFRYAARHADLILCDSNAAKDEVVERLGADPVKIRIVYLGLTNRESSPADTAAVQAKKPYILSVGVTDPNKNFPVLVEAFGRLVADGRNLDHRLVIAGPAGRDQGVIEEMIRDKGLENHVYLSGRVSDSRLAALYENASLFAFPSLCEGFGFPPLEAMHYGVPVVASNAPCIPETLGEVPLYFDPHDIDGLSSMMHEVISDQEIQKRLVEAGLKRAAEFTWEKTATKTFAVYQSLLDTPPEF
jgi:glycosyltransferase involved in cell wall biosynthesis